MTAPAVNLQAIKVVRLRTDPEWLPERFCDRTSRIRLSFTPSRGERQLFRKRKRIPPSEWAPKNRAITYGPLKGSRWDNDFMPHMRGVMDASFFPSVRFVGNCKTPQTGSSAGVETMLGYVADMQPGDALIVYPDRDTASKRCTDYLQPMFKNSPRLRRLMTGVADDMAALRIKLRTMLVYMGWAGSVTSLGNVSARYLIGDEVDKWPEQPSKKEAGSLGLFFERARSFKFGAKIWLISTPTIESGAIWVYLTTEADVVFDYKAVCPHCGTAQVMVFDNIDFDGCRDPKVMVAGNRALYMCSAHGCTWDDRDRDKAVRVGYWVARQANWQAEEEAGRPWGHDEREIMAYLQDERPRKICFYSPGWISPLVSLSECAAAFLKGLKSKKAMHYFDTQIKAVPYRDFETQRKEDAILALKDDRPEALVPGNNQVAALVAGVDTQDNGFYFVIRAIGWGLEQPSWKVRFGFVQTWPALEQVLFIDQYKDSQGLFYPVHLAVQDAMGHRTSEVYDFSRRFPGRLQPYKGGSGRRATPTTWSTIDTYPGTSTKIPGGVRLVTCDTHYFKDELATKLKIKPDDTGAYLMHSGTSEEYAAHLCAEYKDERGLWQCPKGKPNHYWDCEMMAGVAADLLQIKFWKPE